MSNPSKVSPCLAAALEYLERGWSVLPLCPPDHQGVAGKHEEECHKPGKVPLLDSWKSCMDRLPRPAEVKLWWNRWPTANVGVALGPVSKLVDLDLDGPEGIAAWDQLARGVEVPVTLAFDTPGLGRRLIFSLPDGLCPPNRILLKGPDGKSELVRFQSKGLQTVMPPSIHQNGGTYEWIEGCRPGEVDAAPIPDWLLQLVQNSAAKVIPQPRPRRAASDSSGQWQRLFERARKYLREMGPCHPEADHPMDASQHLLKAATAMWGFGFDEAEAVELLAEWDQSNAVAPYSEKELRRKYQQAAQHCGKAKGYLLNDPPRGPNGTTVPGSVPLADEPASVPGTARPKPVTPKRILRRLAPYRPFPLDALPSTIREYVRQAGLSLGCDPAYVALPALAVVASAIGNTRTIRLRRGWEEPSIIWALVLGDSGTLKTPAYLRAVARLFTVQDQLIQQYKLDWSKWKQSGKDGDPAPGLKRLVCSDTTVERLAEILEDNPRGLLVARDELSGWLGSFTRYKGRGGGTDLPNWLEMHRAGTIVVDRKNRRESKGFDLPVYVRGAAVSVTGSIQPGVLARALTSDFLEAGLAARFLMAMPPKNPKRWMELEVHPDTEEAYNRTLNSLLELTFDSRHDQRRPYAVDLSDDGKAVWADFYNEWADEQAAAEGDLAAAYSKLEGYAARFALLHHVTECAARGDDGLTPIEPDSVRAGIMLCQWFSEESRRIYGTFSESSEDRTTRRLVEFIEAKGGRITVRELMRGSRRYPNAETAEAALAELVEAGLARWIDPQTAMKGGKAIKTIELCMTHDSADTADSADTESANQGGDTNDTGGFAANQPAS